MTLSNPVVKAAILLKSLAPVAVEKVLSRLRPEDADRLRGEMQQLEQAPPAPQLLKEVLEEFEELLRAAEANSGTAIPTAENEPTNGRGLPKPAAPTLQVFRPPPPEPSSGAEELQPIVLDEKADALAALRLVDSGRLAVALQGENPHTVSLVLNWMEAEQAGGVLKRLPPEMRRDVSVRLSHGVSGAVPVLQRIARALLHKCKALEQTPSAPSDEAKFKKMADMLRLLEKPDRMEILTALEENDKDLAARVKAQLYQFEDLLLIEDRSMQKLLSEVDLKSLAMALKGAAEEIQDKVRNNLSKRARETLNEEMEFMGSVPSAQIQQAQSAVVEVIQRLDQAGELVMKE
jgi:flagellar motor switch protein FliG